MKTRFLSFLVSAVIVISKIIMSVLVLFLFFVVWIYMSIGMGFQFPIAYAALKYIPYNDVLFLSLLSCLLSLFIAYGICDLWKIK
jgi:hypothetical protein